jgi:hypothetical protein
MPNDRKPDVSFSARAEDYIRRFMKVAEETMANANLVPVIEWYISKKFTSKVTLCLPGRIPDMFDGQKRAACEAKCEMRAFSGL